MHIAVLSQFDKPYLPIMALTIFLVCFLVFLYWTFKKENKKRYEDSSYIALTDGVKHGPK